MLKLSLLFCGILALDGVFRYLSYEEPPEFPKRITLETTETYSPGSVTTVPQAKAWLIRDKRGLYAISGECTHLGCRIQHKDDNLFECPCHGSRFDLNGGVKAGPANSPLRHFEVSQTPDGKLVIDTQVTVPVNQRL